jgi:serine/threonine-protein kinase
MTAEQAAPSRRPKRSLSLLPKTIAGRRRLLAAVILGSATAAGYLTTCIAYPRPFLRSDNSVARVIGLPADEAQRELEGLGFKAKIQGQEPDPSIPAGRILWQDPPPEVILPRGAIVTLTQSSGPAPVPVPDVTNFELEQATKVVLAAGLRLGTVDTVPSSEDEGVVVAIRPEPGSGKPPGSSVTLVVSQGPASVEVPNVVGLRQDEARRLLDAAGLRVGRVSTGAGRRGPPGTVVEQRPASGARTTRQGRVDLIVTEVN